MKQYWEIKSLHQDKILLFRMGDFYEMFFEDAKEAAQILDITLTRRQGIPMCGVPFHAVDSYLAAAVFSKDSVQTVRIGWFTSAPAVC